MTRIPRIARSSMVLASMCVVAMINAAAHAALDGDDHKNAATWYAKSIAAWQAFKQSNPQQVELIANYAGDPTQPITPEIRAALTSVQGAIGDFKKGSQQEYCDFSLDYSQGFELLLPHLGEMRGIARAMRADAAVRLADGDTAGAAAELAAMYKTSGHFGDDRVLISSLVGQAVFAFADAGVQTALDSAAFNAADAAALLNGAVTLGGIDPFQYAEAVGMEQEIALATFEKYKGPEGMQRLGALLGDNSAAEMLGGLDEAQFDEELAKYDAMMTRVNAAFSMTDQDAAMAEMKAISEGIESGESGVLAKLMAPAFSKCLERKIQGEKMIADRIATLRSLASGDQKPEEVANAALWYLRAIELWEALPETTRETLLSFDPRDAGPVQEPVVAALIEVQPIIDVVREASIKRRCDFATVMHHRGPPVIAPHYAPGMHELLAALQADAVRLQSASDKAASIDRYATALRLTGHLGGDVNLAACRTAHVNFNAIIDLLEAAQRTGALDVHDPSAVALADAAGRVSRKDPFGYVAALDAARKDVAGRFAFHGDTADPESAQRWAAQMQLVRSFSADQTMFMLIMLDEQTRHAMANAPPRADGAPEPEYFPITLPETIERLDGVFDAEAVAGVRALYDQLNARFEADDFQIFVDAPAPPVASLNEGIARSRGDLRRATALLMLPEDPPAAEAAPAVP